MIPSDLLIKKSVSKEIYCFPTVARKFFSFIRERRAINDMGYWETQEAIHLLTGNSFYILF